MKGNSVLRIFLLQQCFGWSEFVYQGVACLPAVGAMHDATQYTRSAKTLLHYTFHATLPNSSPRHQNSILYWIHLCPFLYFGTSQAS